MQLTMTTLDRIRVTDLFPKEDDMQTRMLCRDIGEKIMIDQADVKKIDMKRTKMPDGSLGWVWNEKKAENKKVLFTRAEGQFLKQRVDELNEKKKVKDEQLDLFVKIQEAKLKDKKSSGKG